MPIFITTGSYTSQGIRGLVNNPSDREAATRALVEAAGGKLLGYYLTTGDQDFIVIVEAENSTKMIPGLMVVGATGTVTNIKTVRAYTNDEFMAMQKAAGALMAKFRPTDKG